MILRAEQITKVFPGTVALDHVDFDVHRGKVNVLIGENGAGKSTLVRIIAGADRPSSGRLLLDGREIRLHSTRDADALGIGIIHQELSLFPNLSVAENIFMGRHITRARLMIDAKEQRRAARELLDRLEQRIDPDTLAGNLPLGQQQIVEIARALARDVRILMMDEPTSALSTAEIGVLFRLIGELRARGVAIVYISHKLEELLAIGDFVTVLRDGRLVASAAVSDIDVPWIVERMTGRAAGDEDKATPCPAGDEVLRVSTENVSFAVRAGEIVGLYGLLGAGRTELIETIGGVRPHAGGQVFLAGRDLAGRSIADRIAAGIAIVPEDRQAAGLVPTLSVRDNITLASLSRHARAGYLSPRVESAAAAEIIAALRIRTPNPRNVISSLSGGNQQKAVIAKCLLTSPKALLLDEPTRGVDVGARAEIFHTIRSLAQRGIAVVFASSDLHEVMTLADRILVMARGRITGEFDRASADEHSLVTAACVMRTGGADARN